MKAKSKRALHRAKNRRLRFTYRHFLRDMALSCRELSDSNPMGIVGAMFVERDVCRLVRREIARIQAL